MEHLLTHVILCAIFPTVEVVHHPKTAHYARSAFMNDKSKRRAAPKLKYITVRKIRAILHTVKFVIKKAFVLDVMVCTFYQSL